MKQLVNARNEVCYPDLALCLPRILLPVTGAQGAAWPVVACDQYTSEPEYWQHVEERVGSVPSTRQLIYPEVYLEAGDRQERIAAIHSAMQHYTDESLLEEMDPGLMLVDRDTAYVKNRRGIVVALDLEAYDYRPDSHSLIRATEATVPSRLPPRVAVRDGAQLELPHILMLVDDRVAPLMDDLFADRGSPDYDVKLMADGGQLRGWHVAAQDPRAEQFVNKLETIRQSKQGDKPILIAVGDGNHSFAAAKSWWETCKAQGAGMDHPARHALVELLSLYDPGLRFEPIHRLLQLAPQELLTRLPGLLDVAASKIDVRDFADPSDLNRHISAHPSDLAFGLIGEECSQLVSVAGSGATLAVEFVEAAMDELRNVSPAPEIDYIHGLDATVKLGTRPGWCGLLLPALSREHLFAAVESGGSLPRKSFSLGEAEEKRYYMEARRIVL